MHVTIYLKKEPIILLSEEVTRQLVFQVQDIIREQNLSKKQAITSFVAELWEYTTLVPGEGYILDIEDFFGSNPEELALFIDMLKAALGKMLQGGPLKEEKVLSTFICWLTDYFLRDFRLK